MSSRPGCNRCGAQGGTMFIQTETTPNPATLKFLPGRTVMDKGTADFATTEAAERSPLARRLFLVDGVTGVFLGSDFVTITKRDDKEWLLLKPVLLGIIMEHFTANRPTIEAGPAADEVEGEDDELVLQI